MLAVDAPEAARRLLGAFLVRVDADGSRVARIVEVEAYAGPEDRASHARAGRTPRNAPMFGPAGHAYVYRVYGMHLCLNVVCGADEAAAAVLVRAAEPVAGVAAMRRARLAALASGRRLRDTAREAIDRARIDALPEHALASGPALLAAALSVGQAMSGADLCAASGALRLCLADDASERTIAAAARGYSIVAGTRVGVAYAGEPWSTLPWRFAIADSLAVSRPRPPRVGPAAAERPSRTPAPLEERP